MLWFFEKDRSRLHYEIRRQSDGHDFELIITFPDGRQEVERFSDAEALAARSEGLQHALLAAGWASAGAGPRLDRKR